MEVGLFGGDAGNGSISIRGGDGGNISLAAGKGGNNSSGPGGIGGSINLEPGVGGISTGGNGSGSSGDVVMVRNGGNVGIGTFAPHAKLQVAGGDVFIATQSTGLILRAIDGANCYRLTVNNAGVLGTTLVPCP